MGLARIIPAVAVVAALAVPATAHAGPASTASAAAKHRYVAVTHRRALHWQTSCRRRTTSESWRCRSEVWNGATRGTYIIRVRGGVARITDEAYVA
jgi:invasion protein IalB